MSGDTGAEGGGEAGVGGLLLNQPVVVDNGSSSLKAGFAGGSKPKVCPLCSSAHCTADTLLTGGRKAYNRFHRGWS
jgi:Actin